MLLGIVIVHLKSDGLHTEYEIEHRRDLETIVARESALFSHLTYNQMQLVELLSTIYDHQKNGALSLCPLSTFQQHRDIQTQWAENSYTLYISACIYTVLFLQPRQALYTVEQRSLKSDRFLCGVFVYINVPRIWLKWVKV